MQARVLLRVPWGACEHGEVHFVGNNTLFVQNLLYGLFLLISLMQSSINMKSLFSFLISMPNNMAH